MQATKLKSVEVELIALAKLCSNNSSQGQEDTICRLKYHLFGQLRHIILILPCTFFFLEAVNPGFSFSSQGEAIRYDVEATRELFKKMEEHLSKLEFKVSKL